MNGHTSKTQREVAERKREVTENKEWDQKVQEERKKKEHRGDLDFNGEYKNKYP